MPQTILVQIDGSDGGQRAVDYALDAGERTGAAVHGVYVVDTPRYGEPALSSAEIVVDEAEDQGRELLSRLAERGAERGVDVTTRCCHAPPQEAAVEQAAAVDADLAVVGCTGNRHRTVKRLDGVVDDVVDATRRAAPGVGDRQ